MKGAEISLSAAGPAADAAQAGENVLDQAIAWAVRMESGAIGSSERDACAAWRAADPAHERAWQRVQQVEQTFRAMPAGTQALGHRTLEDARSSRARGRRSLLKLAGLGALGVALGALAMRIAPLRYQEAYATAVGQRRQLALPDGTELFLNTGTDVQVRYSPLRRLIELNRGEVHINTGRDEESLLARPFWVHTAHARLEALGTRFSVRVSGDGTALRVYEGRVAIETGGARMVVSPGDAVLVPASLGAPVRPLPETGLDARSWTDGVLVVRDMRLDAFAAELSRYAGAPLRCDREVGALLVSGVFQLDGRDPVGRALEVLAATLPVRVQGGVLVPAQRRH